MKRYLFTVAALVVGTVAFSQTALTVDVGKPKADIPSTMWGIFFEDINFAADGGLYAEMVKNRSFEFNAPLMGWTEQHHDRFSMNAASGAAMIVNRGEADSGNPRFARITVNADRGFGLTNEGFRGMGIKKDLVYRFSVLANVQDGNTKIRAELTDENGMSVGTASLSPEGKGWKRYTVNVTAARTVQKGKLNVWFDGKGVLDVDMISLFPSDTWKGRPGGMRADLVQLLSDMKPGFLRFPGGCIVEGRELASRYQWKKTVGQTDDRKMIINRWNTEFAHRPAPDYFQTFGLGFFEYFQLSEDLGAEPLPILSCGMACQFNSAEVVPLDQLDPFVQDALDLIEFANGDATTAWGKLRTEMGHATPFNLKMIGVGNEQWGPQYIERYKLFVKAIKDKYPAVKIVTGNGPFPEGELFDYADKTLRGLNAEIIDEHYYKNPDWFFRNATRYDTYDRKGPKIFAGEYAAQSGAIASPDNKNNWECALSEAAFMTGLERNAEVVNLCSYAPLFAHVEGWQWTPDLIWFNNLTSFGTPNYYVQKMFSVNKGSKLLSIVSGNSPVTGQNKLYASAVQELPSGDLIVKLVNGATAAQSSLITVEGVKKLSSGKITVLTSDLSGVNSLEAPMKISPAEQPLLVKGKKVSVTLPPASFCVIRIKTQ